MLQTIDVLIGFSVVMLVLSAIVTMLIQLVTTTIFNLKGRVLKEGVAHLLRLLDKNGLTNDEAISIADAVLRNTLVARPGTITGTPRLAGSIHREELVKLLLDFAAGADLTKADALAKGEKIDEADPPSLSTKLAASLRRNKLDGDPKDVLAAVRGTMLALEKSAPALANDVRSNMALLEHASSEFLGKMNAWFDQSIDRTVAIFTERTRLWTVVFSFAVAVFFQVNTFDLLKRLSVNHDATATLVAAAVEHPEKFAPKIPAAQGAATSSDATSGNATAAVTASDNATADKAASKAGVPDTATAVDQVSPPSNATAEMVTSKAAGSSQSTSKPAEKDVVTIAGEALTNIRDDKSLKQLVDTNLIKWPTSWTEWRSYWSESIDWYDWLVRLVGILLTVGLLSLGAPVWYEALKNLIQLRTLAARKDDEQRTVRQTNQT